MQKEEAMIIMGTAAPYILACTVTGMGVHIPIPTGLSSLIIPLWIIKLRVAVTTTLVTAALFTTPGNKVRS